ncbi:hypothetical protein [Nostoc sp.]|uniref:hypothetical protein n=1 Tax=Nostoc sp. TaxID=1180 RepID=UPI002FF57FDB
MSPDKPVVMVMFSRRCSPKACDIHQKEQLPFPSADKRSQTQDHLGRTGERLLRHSALCIVLNFLNDKKAIAFHGVRSLV